MYTIKIRVFDRLTVTNHANKLKKPKFARVLPLMLSI